MNGTSCAVVRIIDQCYFNIVPDFFNAQTVTFILKPPKMIKSRIYVKKSIRAISEKIPFLAFLMHNLLEKFQTTWLLYLSTVFYLNFSFSLEKKKTHPYSQKKKENQINWYSRCFAWFKRCSPSVYTLEQNSLKSYFYKKEKSKRVTWLRQNLNTRPWLVNTTQMERVSGHVTRRISPMDFMGHSK